MEMAPSDVLEGHLLISKVPNSKEIDIFFSIQFKMSVIFYLNILNYAVFQLLPLLTEWKPSNTKEGGELVTSHF